MVPRSLYALAFLAATPLAAQPTPALSLRTAVGEEVRLHRVQASERLDATGELVTSWQGVVEGDASGRAVLTSRAGFTAGVITTNRGTFYLDPLSGGALTEVRTEDERPCGTEQHGVSAPALSFVPRGTPPPAAVIDLLIYYTPAAVAEAGGLDPLLAAIENAFDLANAAFVASEAPITLRSLGIEPLPGAPAPGERMIDYLFGSSQVAAARNALRADLVAAVVSDPELPDSCGIARLFNGTAASFVSVTARGCIPRFTFTHEIGHNLAARHEPQTAGPIGTNLVPPFGFGHGWCPTPQTGRGTVMNTTPPASGCTWFRINQFSNPAVFFEGTPTGVAGARDNAAVVRAAAPYVEAFRQGPCAPTENALCLRGGRFKVEVAWRRPDGSQGMGHAVPLTADTGTFWFFNAANLELVIKVLDGCGLNRYFWVFAGGLTNVEVTITVTDTVTGRSRTYDNAQNTAFQPIQDTRALEVCP